MVTLNSMVLEYEEYDVRTTFSELFGVIFGFVNLLKCLKIQVRALMKLIKTLKVLKLNSRAVCSYLLSCLFEVNYDQMFPC